MLNNVCSNISLIDSALFNKFYSTFQLATNVLVDIQGIGKATTAGYCVIPIWIEGFKDSNQASPAETLKKYLLRIDYEFHLVDGFKYGVLMGLDAITDFQINLLVASNHATLPGFSYKIRFANKAVEKVPVRVEQDMLIPGRTCQPITIKSHMLSGCDYIFTPQQFLNNSILPSLALPYAVINNITKHVMFQNCAVTPINFRKGDVLGEASMGTPGIIINTSSEINWTDLTNSGPRLKSDGIRPPTHVASIFYS